MISTIFANLHYFVAILLFLIGFHTMLTHSNLIKKIIGMNIMETSVFLLFISVGYVRGGNAPIIDDQISAYINPLPSALILTGIVVGVSLTAFALAMVIKIYEYYGTVNTDEIMRLRDGEE
ncbi:MAG: cation:proton antiporter [Firmicutes bacterium]|nr:cation:proton antiporter [Bacillota bacterium]